MLKVISVRIDEDIMNQIKEKLEQQATWTYNTNCGEADIIRYSLNCYLDYLNGNLINKNKHKKED